MPAKSLAQLRLMFAKEKRGEVPKGTGKEMADKTPDISKLPKYVARGGRMYAAGGAVEEGFPESKVQSDGSMSVYGSLMKDGEGDEHESSMEQDEAHGAEEESYGPGYMMEVTCPHCGNQHYAHGGAVEEGTDDEVEEREMMADGGPVGRKNASSATETGMTRSDYDPYEEARAYTGPSESFEDKVARRQDEAVSKSRMPRKMAFGGNVESGGYGDEPVVDEDGRQRAYPHDDEHMREFSDAVRKQRRGDRLVYPSRRPQSR